jgi:hypothetical protein
MSMKNNNDNKIIYYAGFRGYHIPIKPMAPITREEALSRKTYCIGYYNNEDVLICFEKYLDDKLFFRHEYKYYPDGVIKENKISNDVETKTNYYDKKGKLIKTNE